MSKFKGSDKENPYATTEVRLDAQSISYLEGGLLTIIDASIQDAVQRKALKDVLRKCLWDWSKDWQFGFTKEQWEANQSTGEGSDK